MWFNEGARVRGALLRFAINVKTGGIALTSRDATAFGTREKNRPRPEKRPGHFFNFFFFFLLINQLPRLIDGDVMAAQEMIWIAVVYHKSILGRSF